MDFRITSNKDSLAYPLGLDGKLAGLAMTVGGSADAAPTQPDYDLFQIFSRKLDDELTKWSGIKSKELPAFQKLTDEQHLHTIVVREAGTK